MATWIDGSTDVLVEVGFTASPLTALASVSWTDVTAYVREFSIRRGRTDEYGAYAPGTLSVRLNNHDRRFDPENSAGPYSGNLLPMRRIRVRATQGGTRTLFVGYVTGWPQSWEEISDAVVDLRCVDATRLLDQTPVRGGTAVAALAAGLAECVAFYELSTFAGSESPALVGNVDLSVTGVPVLQLVQRAPIFRPDVIGRPLNSLFFAYVPTGGATVPTTTATGTPIGQDSILTNGFQAYGLDAITVAPLALEVWVYPTAFGQGGSAGGSSSVTSEVIAATTSTNYIRAELTGANRLAITASNSTLDRSGSITLTDGFQPGRPAHLAVSLTTSNLTVWINNTQVAQIASTVGTSSTTLTNRVGVNTNDVTLSGAQSFSNLAVYSAVPTSWPTNTYLAGVTGYGHPFGDRCGARAGRVLDIIGWPAADRSLGTGDTVLGPVFPAARSAWSLLTEAAEAEQALLFISGDGLVTMRDRQWQWNNTRARTAQITFGDQAGETPYVDISIAARDLEHMRNTVAVTAGGSASVIVSDSSSVTTYGVQDATVSVPALPNSYLARQLGAFLLRLRKGLATRVPSIEINGRTSTTVLGEIIDLELGDRVVVNRRPTGGTGSYSLAMTVQGIAHSASPDRWTTRLYLSPAQPSYTEGPYLTMGDATYGDIGVAAGNLVPY
jgi:hypothetical protein